jgi:hypothetical protein
LDFAAVGEVQAVDSLCVVQVRIDARIVPVVEQEEAAG